MMKDIKRFVVGLLVLFGLFVAGWCYMEFLVWCECTQLHPDTALRENTFAWASIGVLSLVISAMILLCVGVVIYRIGEPFID